MTPIHHSELFDDLPHTEQSSQQPDLQDQLASTLSLDHHEQLIQLLQLHQDKLIRRFSDLLLAHQSDFEQLSLADRKHFSTQTLAILSENFQLGDTAPELNFQESYPHSLHTRAIFNDCSNAITLFESTCPKTPADLFAILVHEFNHYLQFREQLISEEIGLEGLIEAYAEKFATIPLFSQHIDRDILAENTALQIFYSDQQLAPNTQALLDQLAQGKIQKNLKSSPNRLRAKAYNENKKTYINREESLDRKGDYSEYRNQLLEQESYALEEALRQVFKDTIPPPSAR